MPQQLNVSKYRNRKTTVCGREFDSKAEALRYIVLTDMAKRLEIFGLECQVPFDLCVNGQKICRYIADFVYTTVDGTRVVEDVKGVRTRDYILKAKLMQAIHGITIREVRAR